MTDSLLEQASAGAASAAATSTTETQAGAGQSGANAAGDGQQGAASKGDGNQTTATADAAAKTATTGDGKTQGDAANGKTSDTGTDAKAQGEGEGEQLIGAPEQYAEFNFGEGLTVHPELLGEYQGLAKEINLSQAGAQKLIDFQKKVNAHFASQVSEESKGFLDQTMKLPYIQENGMKVATEDMTAAVVAMSENEAHAKELGELFKRNNIGNHPVLVRAMIHLGKEFKKTGGDGRHVQGNSNATATKTNAERLFGETPAKTS